MATDAPYRTAQRHLARRDPVLKDLIGRVGPCTLQSNPDGLGVLARSIVAQLISTKAAASVYARLEAKAGPGGVTAEALLTLGEESIRACGLSRTKTLALLDLAARSQNGQLPFAQLPSLTDDEVLKLLLPVRGVGVWTGQMFLIFCLGRLDVLPVDDFGLRAGVQEHYRLEEMPSRAELRARAEAWAPYRSIATWYFWRGRGLVPQS